MMKDTILGKKLEVSLFCFETGVGLASCVSDIYRCAKFDQDSDLA